MIYLIIPVIFYCISGAFDAFMDTIKDHWSTFGWRGNVNPQFWNPAISWKNKYIDNDPTKGHKTITILGITFDYPDALTDAWHIGKIFREGCNILAIVTAFMIPFTYNTILIFLALVALIGVLRNLTFDLFYNHLLVKK